MTQLLALPGIDVNQVTNDGRTPFSSACTEGREEIVRQLLNHSEEAMGSEEEYRKSLEEDTKKVQEDQLNKLTPEQFVRSAFPEDMFPGLHLEKEDDFTLEKMSCPVRLLPCKHPCEASTLQTWFQTAKFPNNPNYKHNECTICRKVPEYIEVMNRRQIERWNRMAREEEVAESTLREVRQSAVYRTFVNAKKASSDNTLTKRFRGAGKPLTF